MEDMLLNLRKHRNYIVVSMHSTPAFFQSEQLLGVCHILNVHTDTLHLSISMNQAPLCDKDPGLPYTWILHRTQEACWSMTEPCRRHVV